MAHCTCAFDTSWCPQADDLFGVDGVHVLDVITREDGTIVLDVETDQTLVGSRDCGVVAVGHGPAGPAAARRAELRATGAGAVA